MKKCYILLLSCFAFGLQSVASEDQNQNGSAAPKEQPHLSYREARGRNVEAYGYNVVDLMGRCIKPSCSDGAPAINHPCPLNMWNEIFKKASENGLMNADLGYSGSKDILHQILTYGDFYCRRDQVFKMAVHYGADINSVSTVAGKKETPLAKLDFWAQNYEAGSNNPDSLYSRGYFNDFVRETSDLMRFAIENGANPGHVVDERTGETACESQACKDVKAQYEATKKAHEQNASQAQ